MTIEGSGGYYLVNGGYDESARDADILFGEVLFSVTCYVNRCVGEFTVPESAEPGVYIVRPVDRGEGLAFTVTAPPGTPGSGQ